MNLAQLGWDAFFERSFAPFRDRGLVAARVACEHRHSYRLFGAQGELLAELAGRFRHRAASRGDLPAVGDWVAVEPHRGQDTATIHAVLPRKSRFSRKSAGATTEEQILAANVDTLFLVSGLDSDFNARRIERYVAAAWDSGASPVIVLNKADLCDDIDSRRAEVEAVAVGAPVHAVSAARDENLDCLRACVADGKTAAFLGSSGVGKSSLINRLLGDGRQRTFAVRDHDSHGRHTTTERQLLLVPGGGILIDTPGLRELALWQEPQTAGQTFDDIDQLAARCRFTNCTHSAEPGCAVLRAIADGSLDPGRLDNYRKLQRELRHLASRQDHRLREQERQRWRQIAKFARNHKKHQWD